MTREGATDEGTAAQATADGVPRRGGQTVLSSMPSRARGTVDTLMTRELLAEIGETSSAPDVWIDIDCEALGAEVSGP